MARVREICYFSASMERYFSPFVIPSVDEYIEEPLQIEKFSENGRRKGCVFCTIAYGEDPRTDFLYKDDDFMAFRNITPAASHHYLIIPKHHVQDGTELRPHHIPMLIRMQQIGKEVLAQQGGDLKPYRMGYHWPPFTSVPHLHLHVISSEDEMTLYSKLIFLPGSQWFRSTEEIIRSLRRRIPLMSSLRTLHGVHSLHVPELLCGHSAGLRGMVVAAAADRQAAAGATADALGELGDRAHRRISAGHRHRQAQVLPDGRPQESTADLPQWQGSYREQSNEQDYQEQDE